MECGGESRPEKTIRAGSACIFTVQEKEMNEVNTARPGQAGAEEYLVGIDVGSTTTKITAVVPGNGEIV